MSRKQIGCWTLLAVICAVSLVCLGVGRYFDLDHQATQGEERWREELAALDGEFFQKQEKLAKWYNLCAAGKASGDYENAYPWILRGEKRMLAVLELSDGTAYPIYHGGEQEGEVHHLPGSALPLGGLGNHTVLRGPEILARLQEGDLFYIHIPTRVLAFRVNQVRRVSPGQTAGILPVEGEDLCTLIAAPKGEKRSKVMLHGVREEVVYTPASSVSQFPREEVLRGACSAFAGLWLPAVTGLAGKLGRWMLKMRWRSKLTERI